MKVRSPAPQRPAEVVSAPYSNALLGGGIQDDSRIYTDLLKAIQPGTPGQTPRIAVIASSKVTLTKAWQQHHRHRDAPKKQIKGPQFSPGNCLFHGRLGRPRPRHTQ